MFGILGLQNDFELPVGVQLVVLADRKKRVHEEPSGVLERIVQGMIPVDVASQDDKLPCIAPFFRLSDFFPAAQIGIEVNVADHGKFFDELRFPVLLHPGFAPHTEFVEGLEEVIYVVPIINPRLVA